MECKMNFQMYTINNYTYIQDVITISVLVKSMSQIPNFLLHQNSSKIRLETRVDQGI